MCGIQEQRESLYSAPAALQKFGLSQKRKRNRREHSLSLQNSKMEQQMSSVTIPVIDIDDEVDKRIEDYFAQKQEKKNKVVSAQKIVDKWETGGDYLERLEGVAEEMGRSIENMISIIDPSREPLCGDFGALNQAALILDQYHELMRDYLAD